MALRSQVRQQPALPRRYDVGRLGPRQFRLWSCGVRRVDAGLQTGGTGSEAINISCLIMATPD